MDEASIANRERPTLSRTLFLAAFGLFVFVLPLKFGNPIVLESVAPFPRGGWDWLFSLWPGQFAVLGAFLLAAWGLWVERGVKPVAPRAFWLPCAFLASQLLAMPGSITAQVSLDTGLMFAAGVAMYALGLRQFGGEREFRLLSMALLFATLVVCIVTIQQFFGGLEQTRQFFHLYFSDQDLPAEYMIKLSGNRPFGTFVYSNSLAGFLVLALPVLVASIWELRRSWERSAMWVTMVTVCGLILFSLILSGSKGGFASFAAVVVVAVVLVPFSRRVKIALLALVLICGLALVWRYGSDIFRYASSTLGARLDYWRAGARIVADHPWLGTGPGTFGTIYPFYKDIAPEDPRLAHNNFLEAAADSGILGFLAYTALWAWPVIVAVKRVRQSHDPVLMGLTLSLIGWIVHGLVDFDQYIPSLALMALLFLGLLEARLDGVPRGKLATLPVGIRIAVSLLLCALCALPWNRSVSIARINSARELAVKNPYAAAHEVEAAIRRAPLDAAFHAESARIASRQGRPDDVILALTRARVLDPYRAGYAWELSQAYRQKEGLTESFFDQAETAVSLSPRNWLYRQKMAEAYVEAGLEELAGEHWSAYDEIRRVLRLQ